MSPSPIRTCFVRLLRRSAKRSASASLRYAVLLDNPHLSMFHVNARGKASYKVMTEFSI